MSTPLISVIVPVYNIENYLSRCISTILEQTYTDFELILVDDGCTDSSGKICDEYASKDNRVMVFHKPNGGVSSARNRGIDEARGRYICFIDSDDWVEPTYLQNFMDCHPEKFGMILQGFFVDYQTEDKTMPHILKKQHIHTSAELEYYLEYTDGVHNGFLWHRMFNTETIKEFNIRFPENVSFAEDGIFFLKYISHTTKYYITDKLGYHYFIRSNSLTSKGKKLPKETYFFLLDQFAVNTSAIIAKDKPGKKIINGLTLYMWRLAYGWLWERCMESYDDYYMLYQPFKVYSLKYNITPRVKGVSPVYRAIMKNVCSEPSMCKYKFLLILMKTFKLEQRVRSKLKDIISAMKGKR